MERPVIEVQNLGKKYHLGPAGMTTLRENLHHVWRRLRGLQPPVDPGEFVALRDVSFSIAPGEVVGIIGRNGAGKSTLLKVLSRITEPTSGRAILRGRVASLLEVGTGFHPDLSGRENIFLNGAILGMKRAEIARAFDEIVAFAGVEKFLDTPVKHYSSGMYVRLAFAVAAHLESEILIVDEVLAVGDAEFQRKCLRKMQAVANQDRTIFFVSHNMASVAQLCSRCLLMREGQVRFDGPVAQGIETYWLDAVPTEETFTASFQRVSSDPHFTDVWFEVDGKRTKQLLTSNALTLCIAWRNPRAVADLRLGFGINDRMGGRIFGGVPEDTGGVTPTAAGEHVARIPFASNLLLPKSYSVDLCLWVPRGATFEFLRPAVGFAVLPGPSPILSVDPDREGHIQQLTHWHFDKR